MSETVEVACAQCSKRVALEDTISVNDRRYCGSVCLNKMRHKGYQNRVASGNGASPLTADNVYVQPYHDGTSAEEETD